MYNALPWGQNYKKPQTKEEEVNNNDDEVRKRARSRSKSFLNTDQKAKGKKFFDFHLDYLSKEQCTSLSFGTEPVSQLCYVCPCCNPGRDHKMCKFCYDNCHFGCRDREPEGSEKKNDELNELKNETFACYCGLKQKHKPDRPEAKELVPCNMLQLDQVLNVNAIWCTTHSIQVCCICSVTCHKKCKINYENSIPAGKCNCRSDFHTGFNELALTFPLNEYKEKTGISVWSIQILNILFSTKNIFQKMSDLFIQTLQKPNSQIDESFFPLLELFSNTLNRKFKTFYYNEELIKMFNYENLTYFMFKLPMDNPKILLVKFRLIFIVLFIHLKADFQFIKTLTSIDFMTLPILERFKYKDMYSSPNPMTDHVLKKYMLKKSAVLMKIALEEAGVLMETGMNYLNIEQNQDEFEIGLKFICFLLKRMVFNNDELEKLIRSLYSFYEKFFEYLTGDKSNIYGLLSIFDTLAEIFFMICVSYNDNVIYNYLEKGDKKIESFIHTQSFHGNMLFKMVIKSCDLLKKHYELLQKPDFDEKSKEEKEREELIRKHLQKIQAKIESTTTGVKLKLPENGGLLVEKIVKTFNETLKFFCLADNLYFEQIEKLNKEDLLEYYEFKKKINKRTFGTFYTNTKNKKDQSNELLGLKYSIECYLFNLFNGSYTDQNLRINTNIYSDLISFIHLTEKMFQKLASEHELLLKKGKVKPIEKDDSVKQIKIDSFESKIIDKIKKFFPFLTDEIFAYHKDNFIETLCQYCLDETIAKLLVFFSARDFPHLLSFDLFEIILAFLQLYFLSKSGLKYFLAGKNLTRISKTFRRYSCMKNNKNTIPKYHRDLLSNMPYATKCLEFLYSLGKGIKLYGLSLKHHKILLRFKSHILEHLENLCLLRHLTNTLVLSIKRQICLAQKFFVLFADDFEYEDFEHIKKNIMWLFCNSQLNLTSQNAFVSLFNTGENLSKIITDEVEALENDVRIKRMSTTKVVGDRSSKRRKSSKSKKSKSKTSKAGDTNRSQLSKSGISENEVILNSKRESNGRDIFDNSRRSDIDEAEKDMDIKMYFSFFSIVSKNTYFAYKGSQEAILYLKVFLFNNIEEFKPILATHNHLISLQKKSVLLSFLRSVGFIDYLDKISLFDKRAQLTNKEYKTMIYNGLVHIEGLEETKKKNATELDADKVEELIDKYDTCNELEKIIDLFIIELNDFPLQCENETVTAIQDFITKLIFNIKFISDFFYLSHDLVNKVSVKLYQLTKEFMDKSDLIKRMLNDIKESGTINDNYDKVENPRLKEISYSNFNLYDKNKIYKYLSEEIDMVFNETGINSDCCLAKYLDVFDNMAEANFTPFSLLETYDYEYFYQEASNEEKEELLKDKIEARINNISKVFIDEFINIPETNFFNVITSSSNESMRIDFRKKIVNYFHAFFNSTEGYLTYKLEPLICIINKMLFFDGEGMQEKFSKMRNDKFFFPNFNTQIHQFIILAIISSKNLSLFDRSMRMISLTKLSIQFIQLLGEGFNFDYHDNIFHLQKDVLGSKKFEESEESSYSGSSSEEESSESESISEGGNQIDSMNASAEEETENQNTKLKNKKDEFLTTALPPGSEENKIIFIEETIYQTMLINLKRVFSLIDMGKAINAEMPYDKLIVLTTNLIDFLIEFIDSTEENEDFIISGMANLFFGFKQSRRDTYFDHIEKRGLIQPAMFTKIKSSAEEYQLRKKLICYVKINYLKLLISYLQTGKHADTVVKLIQHRCSTIELFSEILYNFHSMIMQIKLKDENVYNRIVCKQSDESFVQTLLDIYIYEETFRDIIEFPLCLKFYVLIRTYEELYDQNMLKNHFEKIMQIKELKQNEPIGPNTDIDINSYFSKRVYMFLERLVLKVEVKTQVDDDEEEENKVEVISGKIVEGIQRGEADETEFEGNQNSDKKKEDVPETRITFFVRPYLTYRLSNQSKISFEEKVDRTNATSKFLELVAFSDYSLFEMVVNEHLIGNSSFKKFSSNLTYIYIEVFNYLIISIHNILIVLHYYRSPNLSLSVYDIIDESMTYHLFPDNYYLGIFQTCFISTVLINWFYFKFTLTYQHNIMKKYNKNFVFRKKGEGVSETVSNTIVRYFQDPSMSVFSVILDKNSDVSYLGAFKVAFFDSLLFNREICIFLYNLILMVLYFKFHSSMFLVVPMIFIANISPTLFDIFKAMTMKFSNMITVLIFTCLIVYLYMWVTYFYMSFLFDFTDIVEKASGAEIHEVFCNSSLQCFLYMLQQGLRAGGGIGETLPNMSFQTDPGFFMLRFFYDMIFFIFIIMILFNVFMGIIVDTFAELRDINWSRENDINNICFICQLSRDDCLTKNIDYNKHVKNEHFLWNYVYFLVYLHVNNPNDFNSIENSVWEKLEEQDFGWIPIDSNAE